MSDERGIRARWKALLAGRLWRLGVARWALRRSQTAANLARVRLRKSQVAFARRVLARHPDRPEITTRGGARGIVEQAFRIGRDAGGSLIYVGSGYRPSSVTVSGNTSDHARNNELQAARDIGRHGTDLHSGPPTPELDRACVAIGRALGRSYYLGQAVIDTFMFQQSYRVQVIYRTSQFGDHRGHVHVGCRRI